MNLNYNQLLLLKDIIADAISLQHCRIVLNEELGLNLLGDETNKIDKYLRLQYEVDSHINNLETKAQKILDDLQNEVKHHES